MFFSRLLLTVPAFLAVANTEGSTPPARLFTHLVRTHCQAWHAKGVHNGNTISVVFVNPNGTNHEPLLSITKEEIKMVEEMCDYLISTPTGIEYAKGDDIVFVAHAFKL